MNTPSLPEYIRISQLIANHAGLEGTIPLSSFERLKDMLCNKDGHVSVQLHFGKDEEGIAYIKGSLNTQLNVLCQRCMQAFDLPLSVSINLSPVTSDQAAKNLPKHYDPLPITEDLISLRGILEEELLLNLPLVPKHEPEKCSIRLQNSSKTGDNGSNNK